MLCTKEQIEQKRLAALEKKNAKKCIGSPVPVSSFFPDPASSSQNGSYKMPSKENTNRFNASPYSRSKPIPNETSHSKVVTGTLNMISETRFEVKPSGYSEQLISVFKNMPTRSYDRNTQTWNFSISCYDELQRHLQNLYPDVVLGTIPKYVLNILEQPSINHNSIDLTPIEPTLRDKLMGFQRDGVSFGIARKGRCLIADDMGLGKTFQALAIADYYKDDWPLLVATTSSMRGTWQSKIQELLPNVPIACIITINSNKDCQYVMDTHTKVVISSYKMVTSSTQMLKDKKCGVVILDESHLLKSHKAQCTTTLTLLTKKAKRVILLSGTPALSRPKELYTQLSIIEPGFFGGFTEYGKRYCAGKQTNFGWDMNGQSNLSELQIILQRRFLIRRTKEQVLKNMREKTREIVQLDSSLLQLSQENQNNLTQMQSTLMSKTKSVEKQAALIVYFKETALIKMKAICAYIKEILKSDSSEKFLIFAHHREVVDSILCTLDDNRTQYICIDGATKPELRTTLVERFQCNESCRCAVLSITAANSGITLTSASLVIFAELHWNPGTLIQAESRAHRIGQESDVSIRYLIAKGTADDYMWPKLQQKLDVLNEVGLSKDTFQDTVSTNQAKENNIQKCHDLNSAPNSALTNQEKQNTVQEYLGLNSPPNKDSFIAGTNIPKNDRGRRKRAMDDEAEKSFMEDEEGDDLLAGLEF